MVQHFPNTRASRPCHYRFQNGFWNPRFDPPRVRAYSPRRA